ncbi:G5 domain-containing protein [Frigoribacterium sp. CFBP 8754]|uniref:G5 domain-containing protein n=1 Tax=Frigoribacterium sp. CFBP 8754 TaxID=2775290 RepID=UPI0017809DC7|nr:G5 domain-containing protein [Frigoribacterium sp. CFBP 8754]MBD8659802.1 G5 domain-containing protein [Frigoribacterium sp. CFBP 8754]
MTHRRTTNTMGRLAVQGAAVTAGLLLVLGLTGCGDAAQAESARTGSVVQVSPSPTPVVTIEQEDVTEVVPFDAVSVDDATRDIGQDAVTVTGQNRSMVLTYDVTYTDDVETSRSLVGQSAVVAPVQQVTSVGTRVPNVAPAPIAAPAPAASSCDANYSGACVPVASDVDCAGGSGNGPAYVQGPVTIVGSDVYDLDRDGDGVACDR